MREKLRGLLGFLGLVEDDYGDYGPSNTPRPFSEGGEEVEEWSPPTPRPAAPRPAAPRVARPVARPVALEGARPASRARPAHGVSAFAPERDVAVVSPTSYNESNRVTDLLRSGRAVVLTTLYVDEALARRLVDFASGSAYALNAAVEILARGIYLVTPHGMRVSPETKERLRAANYRPSDTA